MQYIGTETMPKKAPELKPLQLPKLIKEIKAKPNGGKVAVGGVDGLYLRIVGDSTAWVLCAAMGTRTNAKGLQVVRRLNMGLGPYPEISLSDARQKAAELRKQIRDGIDPLATKKADKQAETQRLAKLKTFRDCAKAVIKLKANELRNEKALAQWESTLETYAYPLLGDRNVSEITKQDIVAVLEPIWRTKHETASRLRGRIEAVFHYAKANDYREGDNPAEWKGTLQPLLGNVERTVEHHAALPYGEIGAFMVALRERQGLSARALELAILTATRSNEVRSATRSEFDLAAKTWTIPAARMKMKKEHRIPLSDAAIELLKALPKIEGTDLMFPAPRGGVMSDNVFKALFERMKRDDLTAHGFRSTFRDWAGETTAYQREVIEHALAHQLKDKAEAAYQRGDLLAKRARLMADWATYCATVQSKAHNVVAINAA
ncbi:tyrosine-type recombinase/integrase [Paraburkholderia nemoris]|uniref:tyrosine-type recombinase/integrase n=1 Tax=Paraburkholderia nemoris TaxID=2793076 RepID=UPI0038B959F0